jgi:ABC-type nitrate/sulfonate/bicarbonate transport system, ATPase component
MAAHPAPAIVVDRVSLDFAGKPLFQDLSLQLPGGRTTCILGPSGCGKSTLLKLIAGSTALPASGEIRFEPLPVADTLPVAWMGQNDLLLPWLPLVDNVLLGARLRHELSDSLRQQALQLIHEAGLAGYEQALPRSLSGGMRQRGALLRTLMEQRPVLLMDEPFSALDALTRMRLQNLAARLTAGATVVLVTHDPLEALRLGDLIVVLAGSPVRVAEILKPNGRPPREPDDPALALQHGATAPAADAGRRRMNKGLRLGILAAGLLLLWQLLVSLSGVPPYILPGPLPVARALAIHLPVLGPHLVTTLTEIVLGLLLGTVLGTSTALAMIVSPLLKRWMLPILVISQAIPVFALAPVLVLWFGYGMGSKVVMAVLIIYFPVTASFYGGMRRTDPDLLELARIMGARPLAVLRTIVIPAALPAFASGVRVGHSGGADRARWVGGMGRVQRRSWAFSCFMPTDGMQIDLMFAALTLLAVVSLALYFCIDRLLDRLIYWQPNQGTSL